MPKETSRTKKIKDVLRQLTSEKADWEPKALRIACLASFELTDAAERRKYHDSIRYLVAQMKKDGALDAPPPAPVETASAKPSEPSPSPAPVKTAPYQKKERKARDVKRRSKKTSQAKTAAPKEASEVLPTEPTEENALPSPPVSVPVPEELGSANEAEKAEGEQSATAKKSFRGPKGKDMKLYLAELLSLDASVSESAIFAAAVRRFGAEGERVNGVGGLAKQQLREGVRDGWLVGSPKEGYRLAPKREEAAPTAPIEKEPMPAPTDVAPPPAPEEKSEPKVPKAPKPTAPVVPQARARKTATAKPLRRVSEPAKDLSASLNEMRFAELLSHKQQSVQKQTGANTFFAEYAARLVEAHYKARGVTVTGRFVVDGADDRGADVILHTVDELGISDVVLLQAKTRSVGQVTVKELREFFGVMSSQRATRGVFITTSGFTTDAVSFIRENPSLGAIDRYKLFDLARAYGVGIRCESGALLPDPALFS